MKVIFSPNRDNSNESINKEVRFLNEMGIETYDFRDFKKQPWKLLSLKAVSLNWYDDINERSSAKALAILIKKICMLSMFKLFGIRIIYNLHNKHAHEGKSLNYNMRLKRFLINHADTIALLSRKSADYAMTLARSPGVKERFYYIGHPAYSSAIPETKCSQNPMVFLYFGMVRPYKNIELLAKAWEAAKTEGAKLIIAGKPMDEDYAEKVVTVCRDVPNLELRLGFVDNEQLDRLISEASVIVCPLNKSSSMNSGSLIKAMCMKRTVIIPDIEMVYDYDCSQMFLYSYADEAEHKTRLIQKFEEAVALHKKDPDSIPQMGIKLFESYISINSDEKYMTRMRLLYLG